jgi:hypothetical protein
VREGYWVPYLAAIQGNFKPSNFPKAWVKQSKACTLKFKQIRILTKVQFGDLFISTCTRIAHFNVIPKKIGVMTGKILNIWYLSIKNDITRCNTYCRHILLNSA